MGYRDWFERATAGVLTVLEDPLTAPALDSPGLGEWSVRDLAGHTSRAWITTAAYLDPDSRLADPDVDSTAGYFVAARAALADPAQVVARGRDAGKALGSEPAARCRELADEAFALVARADDDAAVATPVGSMRLRDYLPTRAFELTVHGLDLCRAVGTDVPAELEDSVAGALALAVELQPAAERRVLLDVLTGRAPASPQTVPGLTL